MFSVSGVMFQNFSFFFLFQNWDLHIPGDVQIDAKVGIFFIHIFFINFLQIHMSPLVQPGREWLAVCGKLPSLAVHTQAHMTLECSPDQNFLENVLEKIQYHF